MDIEWKTEKQAAGGREYKANIPTEEGNFSFEVSANSLGNVIYIGFQKPSDAETEYFFFRERKPAHYVTSSAGRTIREDSWPEDKLPKRDYFTRLAHSLEAWFPEAIEDLDQCVWELIKEATIVYGNPTPAGPRYHIFGLEEYCTEEVVEEEGLKYNKERWIEGDDSRRFFTGRKFRVCDIIQGTSDDKDFNDLEALATALRSDWDFIEEGVCPTRSEGAGLLLNEGEFTEHLGPLTPRELTKLQILYRAH